MKRQHPAISFSFVSDGATPPFYINKVLVSQIFINIIANAAEYSHKNSGRVDTKLLKEGDYYIFSCKDNGIGIPPEEREKVFLKAFRASNARQAKKTAVDWGFLLQKQLQTVWVGQYLLRVRLAMAQPFLLTYQFYYQIIRR